MNELLAPRLEVTDMTVIAVMRETEDSILLAADRHHNRGGIRDLHIKLREVPIKNQHIAWSCSSNPDIGIDGFGEWMSTKVRYC